ncbi:MAG TPA: hypothetical protein VG796_28170 [Verrucomicrobiales bacterium]|nr:hypothetical protein [Verrucomicrobiales bacterium]
MSSVLDRNRHLHETRWKWKQRIHQSDPQPKPTRLADIFRENQHILPSIALGQASIPASAAYTRAAEFRAKKWLEESGSATMGISPGLLGFMLALRGTDEWEGVVVDDTGDDYLVRITSVPAEHWYKPEVMLSKQSLDGLTNLVLGTTIRVSSSPRINIGNGKLAILQTIESKGPIRLDEEQLRAVEDEALDLARKLRAKVRKE